MWSRLAVVAVVVGCAHPGSDRVAAWRDDLRTLATELPKRHVHAFFRVTEADWRQAVDELDRKLPDLDDNHVLAALTRLVAELGDGHTMIGVWGRHGYYPLALVWFDDGIYVVGADDPSAIGGKLVGVGTRSLDDAIAALTPLVSRDNVAGLHGQLPEILLDPAILAGVDLAPPFRLADGRALDVQPAAHGAPVAPPHPVPLHLQGPNTNYWNKYADHLLYFAYNRCAEDPKAGPFAKLVEGTLAFVDQHPVDRFVIDLRRNSGGDSRILQPLIDGLAARPALRVYAIIGMHTFSSAMINAMELKRRVHATLVGGPTAGNPSGYGEIGTFVLPRSKLVVQYSTKLFANPDFPGDAVEPDLPVTVRAADWFAGRDPALDAILADPLPRTQP